MIDVFEPDLALDSEPLVSLAEASQGLVCPSSISFAYSICELIMERNSSMSLDEVAAAGLYTSEGSGSVYRLLNSALWDQDRRKIVPWLPYLKLLMSALVKLPRSDRSAVLWRDIEEGVEEDYRKRIGQEIVWWGLSSMSLNLDVVYRVPEDRPGTLFVVYGAGACLEGVSYMASESEVVLPAGSVLRVISVTKMSPLWAVIELELVQAGKLLGCGFVDAWNASHPLDCARRSSLIEKIGQSANLPEAYVALGKDLGRWERVVTLDGKEFGKVDAFMEALRMDATSWEAYKGLRNLVPPSDIVRLYESLRDDLLKKIHIAPNSSIAYYFLAISMGTDDEVVLLDGSKKNKCELLVEAIRYNNAFAAAYNDLGETLPVRELVLKDGRRMTKRRLFFEAARCGNHAAAHENLSGVLNPGEQIEFDDGRKMTAGLLRREAIRIRYSYGGL
jgi:hypothetical protein